MCEPVVVSDDTVRIGQLSDTHFLEPGHDPEGGFAYDTGAAYEAVLEDLAADELDLVAITGDIADHGRPAQYRRAGDAFARIPHPVNVLAGNHDQDAAFTAGIGRPTVASSPAIEIGEWCFLFADSNAGVMNVDRHGRLVDPDDYGDRLHRNGCLGRAEAARLRALHDQTEAEHVFVWVHHPPAAPVGLTADPSYDSEWVELVGHLPKLRGLGAGHTHVPTAYVFRDLPVFIGPALKNNFDLEAETLLPPGWRRYEFKPDGTITSELRLADDPRWPRHPLGRAVIALLSGELTHAEFDAIVNRKRAEFAD